MDFSKRGRSGGFQQAAPPKRPFQPKRDADDDEMAFGVEEEEDEDQMPQEEDDVIDDSEAFMDEMPSSAGAGELTEEEMMQLEELGQVAAMFKKWKRKEVPTMNSATDDISELKYTTLYLKHCFRRYCTLSDDRDDSCNLKGVFTGVNSTTSILASRR